MHCIDVLDILIQFLSCQYHNIESRYPLNEQAPHKWFLKLHYHPSSNVILTKSWSVYPGRIERYEKPTSVQTTFLFNTCICRSVAMNFICTFVLLSSLCICEGFLRHCLKLFFSFAINVFKVFLVQKTSCSCQHMMIYVCVPYICF